MEIIADVEGNGLNPDRLWCLSWCTLEATPNPRVQTEVDYDGMRFVLQKSETIIGHNFYLWDLDVLERILGIEIKARVIDTLALSWYLYPRLRRHGLEEWGETLGIPKPEIDDWEHLTLEEYVHRCSEDVKINHRLWHHLMSLFRKLYPDKNDQDRVLNYLMFKMKCARLQAKEGWKLDVPRTKQVLNDLIREREVQVQRLTDAMPRVAVTAKRNSPAKPYRKDGSLTKHGSNWERLCKDKGLDPRETTEVEVITGWDNPNPDSHEQLKAWLFSLGWEPCTFKQNKKKEEIPQINDLEDKSRLSPSVKVLEEKEPAISALEGYFLLRHRIAILKGFLENEVDGRVKAEIAGFTNTLRFKHRTIVNLPGVDSPYGKEIRGCLVAPEGYELCGSDMASLEDRTKQHFIYKYDPEYVREMQQDDFDPHLDIAVLSGMMTKEDSDAYKRGDHSKKPIRHKAKTTNYSCTYGAFPPKIARTAGIPLDEARTLWETYWERNHSIKKVAEAAKVTKLLDQEWLWNPVSRMWYSLRNEKDKFSTLNQGTGSFCFDTYLGFVLKERQQVTAQFHDEFILCIRKGNRDRARDLLQRAIDKTNDYLRLNRRLDIGIEFGDNYADIH